MSKLQIPTSREQVKALHSKVLTLKERHSHITNLRKRDIEQRAEQYKRTVEAAPPAVRKQLQDAYAAELQQFRADVNKRSEGDRVALLREISGLKDAASEAKTFMKSPRQLLAAHGLGTQARANVFAEISQYANSPAMLTTLAARARAEAMNPETQFNAKLVASVLVAVVDNLPTNQRPSDWTTAELAADVIGDECRGINAMLSEVDIAWSEAISADRGLSTGKVDPTSKISDAIAKRNIDHPAEETVCDD